MRHHLQHLQRAARRHDILTLWFAFAGVLSLYIEFAWH